ncbi:hypothetical protein ACP4OV_011841 [Aristida adscensionis]
MGDIVASALVQEGVSGVSSYISRMFNEKATTSHMLARLEMALSQLEFSLERTRKMPITYVSLLRRRKVLKCAYFEGMDLLNTHKLQSEEAQKETGKLVTGFPFLGWVTVNAKLSISSLVGLNKDYLTSSAVQIFEWYADCATKFIADVELGNPLQHNTFWYPFVRQLLEEKTLRYEMVKESRACFLYVSPVCLEGRGVEARLAYTYLDLERPEQCLELGMMLRLSEDTDIIGITIKCLRLLTSWFKLVCESAMGELTLVSHLPEISTTDAPPLHWIENNADLTKLLRPDPICCANDAILAESWLDGLPNSVIAVNLQYILHSSIDGVGIKEPPLHLHVSFSLHTSTTQQGFVLKYGGKQQYIGGGIQQMEDILKFKAVEYVLHQQEPLYYYVSWYSGHGAAFIILHKPSNQQAACPKPTAAGRHRRIVLEYGGNKEGMSGCVELTDEQTQKSKSLDCVVRQLEPMNYVAKWYYRNFDAKITLHGSSKQLASCPKPMAGAKRKRWSN